MRRHVVLLTYGEPPTPDFFAQLKYSWRILLGLPRAVAPWAERLGGGRAPVRVLPALDEGRFAEISAAHVAREAEARGAGGKEWALVLAAHGTLLEPARPIETGRGATERVAAAIAQ